MKRFLLLVVALFLSANAAMADHIGIYNDASGSSCTLPQGFNSSVVLMHKFSPGSTGSRFKMSLSPGTTLFGFTTPYATTGSLTTDIAVDYGTCLTGSFVIGSVVAIYQPGTFQILPADNNPLGYILSITCASANRWCSGGPAYVGGTGDCGFGLATESTTWGSVKALYR